MNPQSSAIAESGNPLKSRFEFEIRARILSKSADPFAYSPPSSLLRLQGRLQLNFGGIGVELRMKERRIDDRGYTLKL